MKLSDNEIKIFGHYITDKNLKQYHLKILIALMLGPKTQTDLIKELDCDKSNIGKIVHELLSMKYITWGEQIGTSKYLKINTNVKELQIKGQQSLSL